MAEPLTADDLLPRCMKTSDPAWLEPIIDTYVAIRRAARAQGDWVLADRLRDILSRLDIVVTDCHDGRTEWEYAEDAALWSNDTRAYLRAFRHTGYRIPM